MADHPTSWLTMEGGNVGASSAPVRLGSGLDELVVADVRLPCVSYLVSKLSIGLPCLAQPSAGRSGPYGHAWFPRARAEPPPAAGFPPIRPAVDFIHSHSQAAATLPRFRLSKGLRM